MNRGEKRGKERKREERERMREEGEGKKVIGYIMRGRERNIVKKRKR